MAAEWNRPPRSSSGDEQGRWWLLTAQDELADELQDERALLSAKQQHYNCRGRQQTHKQMKLKQIVAVGGRVCVRVCGGGLFHLCVWGKRETDRYIDRKRERESE